MTKRFVRAAGLLLAVAVASSSCGEASYRDLYPRPSPSPTLPPPPSFQTDVAPLFANPEKGCAAASCHFQTPQHGATGQLVLGSAGLSAETLWENLRHGGAQQIAGLAMDVDTANVAQSLLLTRPTGGNSHPLRFATTDPAYLTLEAWIVEGAPFN